MRKAFADNYVMTGDATYSARVAGYAFPEKAGPRLVRENYAELQEQFADIVMNRLRPAAMRVHLQMIEDPNCPAGPRGNMVKLAYDRADAIGAGADQKELCDMSSAEIESKLVILRAAADRAKLVLIEHEPSLAGGVFD